MFLAYSGNFGQSQPQSSYNKVFIIKVLIKKSIVILHTVCLSHHILPPKKISRFAKFNGLLFPFVLHNEIHVEFSVQSYRCPRCSSSASWSLPGLANFDLERNKKITCIALLQEINTSQLKRISKIRCKCCRPRKGDCDLHAKRQKQGIQYGGQNKPRAFCFLTQDTKRLSHCLAGKGGVYSCLLILNIKR